MRILETLTVLAIVLGIVSAFGLAVASVVKAALDFADRRWNAGRRLANWIVERSNRA